ncbi:hypothetical protein, partial [Bradyrhizobium sp.]|uniref:hypothetical protein n=1 Tax=Bradyrhizobium sp. TaxID=376 RepID=UPI003C53B3C5
MLLVLDNVSDTGQVKALLPGAASCLVLITSRRPLSELEGGRLISLNKLRADEAVQLFRRILGAGDLRTHDMPEIQELLDRLNCLPLAIRIAAAQLRAHPTWEIRDVLDQHISLMNPVVEAYEKSYRDLSPEVQIFLMRIAQHPGTDFDVGAAAALADVNEGQALQLLDDLYLRHLVEEPKRGRYQLHDLIRDLAREGLKVTAASERADAIARLMAHYLSAASRANATLGSTDPVVREKSMTAAGVTIMSEEDALRWLDSEFPNLFACVEYALDEQVRPYCWELPLALGYFVQMRGLLNQGLKLFSRARDLAATSDEPSLARTLTWLACFSRHAGEYQSARAYLREATEIPPDVLTTAVRAQIFRELGLLDCATGELSEARSHYDTAVSLAVAADDKYAEGYALINSGIAHKLSGEYPEATAQMSEAYAIGAELGIGRLQAVSSYEMGSVSILQHDRDSARTHLERALAIYESMGNGNGQANVHLN